MRKRTNIFVKVANAVFLLLFVSLQVWASGIDPVIEGANEVHILIPYTDSFRLEVKNDIVNRWIIEKQGTAGTARLRELPGGKVFVIYSPLGDGPSTDTIAIAAELSSGYKAGCSVTVSNYTNPYQYEGERLLDKIKQDFFNGQYGLYAEEITANGDFLKPVSYLWPASHLLRAFKNGYRQNPEKYFQPLRSYAISLDKYLSDAGGKFGYAAYPGDQKRFYDDNGLMIIQFAEIYSLIADERMLQRARWAYDFCNHDRDSNWGIPQHEDELGQGMFYSMAVNQTGLGAALLYAITHESVYLEEAETYYQQLNNPQVLLKDPVNSLFHQYTFYQGGEWSLSGTINGEPRSGAGFRAYQTTHVVQLAILLYRLTGQHQYLADAGLMLDKAIVYWYRENNGLNENAFWGGDDMIDALLDMYYITGEEKYLEISKNIIDFLIEFGKDQLGYYPGDYNDNLGNWDLDRRDIIPETVLMMGQAAAASAILRTAYAVENDPVVGTNNFREQRNSANLVIFPSRARSGEEIRLMMAGSSQDEMIVTIYSVDGQIVQHELKLPSVQPTITLMNHTPGIYILTVLQGSCVRSGKIIIE